MKLGYITFSSEEQQLVHDVIHQISQGTIDELGLGRLRDAFSDAMFPGMSTLHRRGKYFVLMPALYDQLSKTNIASKSSIASMIREYEINMTISLLNGQGSSDGITGGSLGKEDLAAGKFVKITPTSIYLSSLKYFGLVEGKTSIHDLIYQQSQSYHEHASAKRRTKAEIIEDPDAKENPDGYRGFFIPFHGYDFGKPGKISMKLTAEEANILRSRIMEKCWKVNGEKDNLFSYILRNDTIEIKPGFFDMENVINEFPDEQSDMKLTYSHACAFSRWAHIVNTYYRLAFYKSVGNETRVSELKDYIGNYGNCPDSNTVENILKFATDKLGFKDFKKLCDFCRKASEKLDNNKIDELINIITERESNMKGELKKIGNEYYKGTDFPGVAGKYTYRWDEIVYSMINDIRNPDNEQ
jgi:hypothetical protein